jgi:hypothetical protein
LRFEELIEGVRAVVFGEGGDAEVVELKIGQSCISRERGKWLGDADLVFRGDGLDARGKGDVDPGKIVATGDGIDKRENRADVQADADADLRRQPGLGGAAANAIAKREGEVARGANIFKCEKEAVGEIFISVKPLKSQRAG